jgi:hypothetical protein
MSSDADKQQALSDDLIWGAQAIADFLGLSRSEVHYLLRMNALPVGRLGPKTIFASKQQLRRHFTTKSVA